MTVCIDKKNQAARVTVITSAGRGLPYKQASMEEKNLQQNASDFPNGITFSHYPDAATASEAARYVASVSKPAQTAHHKLNEPPGASARFDLFEAAISTATIMRLLRSTHVISELRQRKSILAKVSTHEQNQGLANCPVFAGLSPASILFDQTTGKALTGLGAEGAYRGYYSRNFGNLLRTGVSAVDENSTAWESIAVRPEYYEALLTGFLAGAGDLLKEEDRQALHFEAAFVTYLRSLELVTDFLQNDINVPIEYAEQNLNRSLNQFILLEQLENFMLERYGVKPF